MKYVERDNWESYIKSFKTNNIDIEVYYLTKQTLHVSGSGSRYYSAIGTEFIGKIGDDYYIFEHGSSNYRYLARYKAFKIEPTLYIQQLKGDVSPATLKYESIKNNDVYLVFDIEVSCFGEYLNPDKKLKIGDFLKPLYTYRFTYETMPLFMVNIPYQYRDKYLDFNKKYSAKIEEDKWENTIYIQHWKKSYERGEKDDLINFIKKLNRFEKIDNLMEVF